MRNKIIAIFVLLSLTTFSQNKILKLELKDSILKNTISNFIISIKKKNIDFERFGYISLRQIYFNEEATNNDLRYKYFISNQNYRPINNLPSFYTYVNNKLVLIYQNSLITENTPYSRKKQRKIDRLVKPFLNKIIHLKIRDEKGKLIINDKYFRDESINVGGIFLSIYANGKVIVKHSS